MVPGFSGRSHHHRKDTKHLSLFWLFNYIQRNPAEGAQDVALLGMPEMSEAMSKPHTERFSLKGQRAIITGASSGIGRAIAEEFAADGADVVVCSREQDNVGPVADEINDSDRPGEAVAIECDVTDREAVEALVEATVDEFGGLDVLVNNAGASFMAGFDDISENGWKTIVDINLHGTYHCTQAAGDALADGDGGAVINLSSVAGEQGAPYMSTTGPPRPASATSRRRCRRSGLTAISGSTASHRASSPRRASSHRWASAPTTSTARPSSAASASPRKSPTSRGSSPARRRRTSSARPSPPPASHA